MMHFCMMITAAAIIKDETRYERLTPSLFAAFSMADDKSDLIL